MAASVREGILQDLETTLASITTGNGYTTTVKQVFRWRAPSVELLSYPSLLLGDETETVSQLVGTALNSRALTVSIQGCFETGMVNDGSVGLLLTNLIQDIEKAVMVEPTRGGRAVDTKIRGSASALDASTEPYAFVLVTVEVVYRTSMNDPTTPR